MRSCTIVALLLSRTAAFQSIKSARARMSALAATAKPTTIVWLRDELRVHDNALLAEAAARGGPVLPVYVLDDRVFDAAAKSESGGSRKCGAKRARFTLEALDDLRTTLGARRRAVTSAALRSSRSSSWGEVSRSARIGSRRVAFSDHAKATR